MILVQAAGLADKLGWLHALAQAAETTHRRCERDMVALGSAIRGPFDIATRCNDVENLLEVSESQGRGGGRHD
jgi:hypothetical protein